MKNFETRSVSVREKDNFLALFDWCFYPEKYFGHISGDQVPGKLPES